MGDVYNFTPRPSLGVEEAPEANLMCGYCEGGLVFQLTESGAWCLMCGSCNTWDEIGDTLDDSR